MAEPNVTFRTGIRTGSSVVHNVKRNTSSLFITMEVEQALPHRVLKLWLDSIERDNKSRDGSAEASAEALIEAAAMRLLQEQRPRLAQCIRQAFLVARREWIPPEAPAGHGGTVGLIPVPILPPEDDEEKATEAETPA